MNNKYNSQFKCVKGSLKTFGAVHIHKPTGIVSPRLHSQRELDEWRASVIAGLPVESGQRPPVTTEELKETNAISASIETGDDSTMESLMPAFGPDPNYPISARDLHKALRVGRDFSHWIKDRLSYSQLTDGEDFEIRFPVLASKSRGGNNRIEYVLTTDAAKEIAILEHNDIGRKVRRYFIDCDKELRRQDKQRLEDPHSCDLDYLEQAKRYIAAETARRASLAQVSQRSGSVIQSACAID
jgi:phage anti-repressor protein